jgi:hypothetical protein
MYTITIIPALESRPRGVRWSKTFEEIPTKQYLRALIQAQIMVLNCAAEGGENDAANLHRGVVCPKVLDVLEYGEIPSPTTRGTRTRTIYHESKRLGSISIQIGDFA